MSLSHTHIPADLLWLISQYHLQSLIISEYTFCTLESGQEYILDELKLEQYSMLTTKPFDTKTGQGGILIIKCNGPITIEKGASINMNGKGYPPSHYIIPNKNKVKGKTPGSYDKNLFILKENKIICDSTNDYGLKLGKGYKHVAYNNPLITGGNGGGTAYIECQELHMNGGNIVCCGEKGFQRNSSRYSNSVCGQGGSIKIILKSKTCSLEQGKILSNGLGRGYSHDNFGTIEIHCPLELKPKFDSVTVGEVSMPLVWTMQKAASFSF
eukprot:156098_1